jgi:hypothetical protein
VTDERKSFPDLSRVRRVRIENEGDRPRRMAVAANESREREGVTERGDDDGR